MRARRLGWVLGWVAALTVAGCIPETKLQPLPDARSLAGEPSAAIAESHGVQLIADGAAWKGYPSNLERRLTPVELRLDNQSGRTLSIRYTFFDLLGESRFQYAALPPLRMDEVTENQPRCVAEYQPGYWSLGFSWGFWGPWPYAHPWYQYGWPGPSYYGPFYDPYYAPVPYVRCEEPLPTQDMLHKSLPEGILANGGTISGFLYFQGVGERERQVTLQARLVDAATGEPFGQVTIPFQVRR